MEVEELQLCVEPLFTVMSLMSKLQERQEMVRQREGE